MALDKMERIRVDDLRAAGRNPRLAARPAAPGCATPSAQGMPGLERAVADYKLDENYQRALELIVSGRAREAFDLSQEPDPSAKPTARTRSARAACSPAG